MNSRSAFTLVELLVVMTIISILAGLLLPVLKESLDAARAMRCASNQKQIGMAFHEYGQQYGYIMKYRHFGWPGRPVWYTIMDRSGILPLGERYNPERVWVCPSHGKWGSHGGWATYAMNARGFQYPRRVSRITRWSTCWITVCMKRDEHIYRISSTSEIGFVHSGRGNFLYLDGHVQALAPPEVPPKPSSSQDDIFWRPYPP